MASSDNMPSGWVLQDMPAEMRVTYEELATVEAHSYSKTLAHANPQPIRELDQRLRTNCELFKKVVTQMIATIL